MRIAEVISAEQKAVGWDSARLDATAVENQLLQASMVETALNSPSAGAMSIKSYLTHFYGACHFTYSCHRYIDSLVTEIQQTLLEKYFSLSRNCEISKAEVMQEGVATR